MDLDINKLTEDNILDNEVFEYLLSLEDEAELIKKTAYILNKAKKFGLDKAFAKILKTKESKNTSLQNWYVETKTGVRFHPRNLSNHIIKNENIFYSGNSFWLYKDGVYKDMSDENIDNYIHSNYLNSDCTSKQVNETKWLIRSDTIKAPDEINSTKNIINCKNTLLELKDNKFIKKEHTPEILSTIQINANYKESYNCDKFKKFLSEGLEDQDILTLQEMIGYTLINSTVAQKFFLFFGKAGCGKSIILTLIQNLLGSQNYSNVSLQHLSDRFKTACLYGKSANIFADLKNDVIEDESIIKAIVGEDVIQVEKKGKDPFNFYNKARCIFSCNTLPPMKNDKTDGFYRRVVIIPFKEPKPENERIAGLINTFSDEIDGIFNWALEGLLRLHKNGYKFTQSEKAKDILTKYKIENNNILYFVEEKCTTSDSEEIRIKCSELYERYQQFCRDCGFVSSNIKNFTRELEQNNKAIKKYAKINGKTETCYCKIDLRVFD